MMTVSRTGNALSYLQSYSNYRTYRIVQADLEPRTVKNCEFCTMAINYRTYWTARADPELRIDRIVQYYKPHSIAINYRTH
jgi:hypothetical protein